ncbi:MAG: NAD(P)/FAD-dependent oxidoreductase, partial [Thermus sp.]|uniref:NAD(P)/FAD-dependent oxidoreductase n=1 Tax=Thermus sp. TaxID=275 RepID=UPI0039191976
MKADAIVVGAGIIGALAAYQLRKRGLSVLLLDAGKEGAATLASAGMLAPYPEGLSGEVLEAALLGLESYPELLAELRGLGLEVEAGFAGTQVVALSHGEGEVWGAAEPPSYPVRGARGARTFPGGYVHPRRLREALLRALAAMDTPLVLAEVERVEPGWVHGRGQEGGFSAKSGRILLAVGAWAGRFGLGVRPLKGEALILESPPEGRPSMPLFAGEGYLLPR